MGWLSFRVQANRKVFLLYEESFHHFKPFYFKVFWAPNTIPFWEILEGECNTQVDSEGIVMRCSVEPRKISSLNSRPLWRAM